MAPDQDIGYIEEVKERENLLLRPPVANIGRVLIVMSPKEPDLSLFLLDRFLVMCEQQHLHVLICFNKSDLSSPEEISKLRTMYESIGYPVIFTSTVTGEGLDALKEALRLGTTAVAGPSGVGKSTILSTLYEGLDLQTGEVSQKTRRGRHTTRHIEITRIGEDAYVLDTPGFSSLDLLFMEDVHDLRAYFPEFPQGECRFDNCLHVKEPDCVVKRALDEGKISEHRYVNYVQFIKEIEEQRRY